MPRPEGVLAMRSKRWFFSRRHERFVSISQGGLSTFKIDRPHDSAILDTRKDLPFEYVDAVEREGKTFVVRRRRRAVAASIFFSRSGAHEASRPPSEEAAVAAAAPSR